MLKTHLLNAIAAIAAVALVPAVGNAQIDPNSSYAVARVESAFELVTAMLMEAPLAEKGDLPPGCLGPFKPDVQAECIDTAYEVGSGPYVIVETRTGATSILTRLEALTLAARAERQHSEE